ncbi:photosystem II repair protein PSB27-H1, chloroplastic-like [Salvia hispanica]|uniref:photosystem II repair protein PSB27-H1, chloroplastic-like n=1 Tax=Salvia hispanica TaxID=49212 RepID=UPI0020098517|nr:photosystem II repair protein PSB27-H1, chloroplastic-like [Salvia hispanica]
MASLINPTATAAAAATQKPLTPLPPRAAAATAAVPGRRNFLSLSAAALFLAPAAAPPPPAAAAGDDEYVKETEEVISKVRATINLDKADPNIAAAVAELRETSNSWVAKYRREKALLGRASFRDMYSALNAVSGHYISFGPTAPIPAKRKQRILEEVETAEKALLRGR